MSSCSLRYLVNAVFYDLKDIRSDGEEGLKTIPVVLGWNRAIRLLYLFNMITPVPLIIGVLAGELPGSALVLIVFTIYDFYYLRHAELSGEAGMTLKDYAIADYEFILWPWAVGLGLVLIDRFGPLPTAALLVLIVLGAAKALFTGRAPSGIPRRKARREKKLCAEFLCPVDQVQRNGHDVHAPDAAQPACRRLVSFLVGCL